VAITITSSASVKPLLFFWRANDCDSNWLDCAAGIRVRDYASQLFRLGDYSPSLYAALAVAILTGLNIIGVQQGKWVQIWFTAAEVLGLLLVAVVGLAFTWNSTPTVPAEPTGALGGRR